MASPGPPLKKCKRVRKANVKYEDDLPQAAPEPAETQEDAEPAEGRRASRRARLSRGNGGYQENEQSDTCSPTSLPTDMKGLCRRSRTLNSASTLQKGGCWAAVTPCKP